jgi:hypothetical protein
MCALLRSVGSVASVRIASTLFAVVIDERSDPLRAQHLTIEHNAIYYPTLQLSL